MPRSLSEAFSAFARVGCPEDPLYVALATHVAAQARWAALLEAAPPAQQLPVLWFAALHDRLLECQGEGGASPLAEYYASLGGHRQPDAALPAALDAFLSDPAQAEAVRSRIACRHTQTNEIGRSAVLYPALCALARHDGGRPMALLDVGCSAGLNLGVDHWRYRYLDEAGRRELGYVEGAGARAPVIETRVLDSGAGPFEALRAGSDEARPVLQSRLGLDPMPVAVDDPGAVRWLRACLWPGDATRRARLDAALSVAQEQRWPVRQVDAGAIVDEVSRWLAGVPAGVRAVVFNSWVLAYFEPAALEAHVEALLRWVARDDLAWISAEPLDRVRRWWPEVPVDDVPARTVAPAELRESTGWTLAVGAAGRARHGLIARSHAHGRWMHWFGGPTGT